MVTVLQTISYYGSLCYKTRFFHWHMKDTHKPGTSLTKKQ